MIWTQLVIVALLSGIIVYLIRSEPSARHLAVRRITVIVVILGGILIVLWPGLLTATANLLGIGRGTDLLLYAAIIAGIIYIVSDYKKSVLVSRTTTKLARSLALTEARLEDAVGGAGARTDDPTEPPRIDL